MSENVESNEIEEIQGKKSSKVVDIIVDRVLDAIEKNQKLIWHKTWLSGQINYYTNKSYEGINIFLLIGGCGEYMTYNQLLQYNKKNKTNYRIKPEETKKYYVVLFFKPEEIIVHPSDFEDARKKYPTSRYFERNGVFVFIRYIKRYTRVWGINQLVDEEGNNPPSKIDRTPQGTDDTKPIKQYFYDMEDLTNSYLGREGIKLYHLEQRAYYRQEGDLINMPKKETFASPYHYHHVLFHEMTHSTGVLYRLNRKCLTDYHNSMSERGQEELIAELGASMLMVDSGVDIENTEGLFDNTTAYLQHWVGWIKENKNAFVYACTQATKAVEYIVTGQIDTAKEE